MEQKKSKSWWLSKPKKETTGTEDGKAGERIKNAKTPVTEKLASKKFVAVPIVGRSLMTKSEQKMYDQLCRALPYSAVFPQVSFNSLVETNEEIRDWAQKQALRSQFNRMVVDFVVYDPKKHAVLAIVELDDPSHQDHERKAQDEKRDGMLRQAGYQVLRYTSIPSDLGKIIEAFKSVRTLNKLGLG